LVDVASNVVLPAMSAVFKDGEVTALELNLSNEQGGSVQLLLTAGGETFSDLVVQGHVGHMNDEEWSERLRSNLVDFVAESRFAWGENREVR
jgi:hypothetical protein